MTNHYAHAADLLDVLGPCVAFRRQVLGLSMRGAAKQVGVAASTIDRVERGEDVSTHTAVALLRWLARPTPTEELP